ncbi:MAG: type II toxin-antitoxin system RelE family toxin [Terriglobia bacterium]
MAAYSLRFKPSVQKDLESIPKPLIARIISRIEQLKGEPFPHQAVKLQGAERLYRLRVGDYRIVYEVDPPALLITIYYVRHRREVYRGLRVPEAFLRQRQLGGAPPAEPPVQAKLGM